MGVIKGDTRSVDYSPDEAHPFIHPPDVLDLIQHP